MDINENHKDLQSETKHLCVGTERSCQSYDTSAIFSTLDAALDNISISETAEINCFNGLPIQDLSKFDGKYITLEGNIDSGNKRKYNF